MYKAIIHAFPQVKDKMKALSLFGSSKIFTFSLDSVETKNEILNKQITIKIDETTTKQYKILDANQVTPDTKPVTLKAVFKVHRLPLDIPLNTIQEFIYEQKIRSLKIEEILNN